MPTISEFFGILIVMYFDDHNPPHFHAKYQGQEVRVDIATGKVLDGKLSRNALRLIEEWRQLHVKELLENWERAKQLQLPKKILPLE